MFNVYFIVGFDVNFMDDVGQTLLNWASAFGTQEMVCIDVYFLFQQKKRYSNF